MRQLKKTKCGPGWLAATAATTLVATASLEAMPSLRVMTYNLRSFRGHLENETVSGFTPALRAYQIGQEVLQYGPDIFTVQEPTNNANLVVNNLSDALGDTYGFGWLDCPQDPNANQVGAYFYRKDILPAPVVSQCINGDPQNLFNHFGRLRFNRGGETLIVYTFKLIPKDNPTARAQRLEQIRILKDNYLLQDLGTSGRSVIVMGDMNHRPNTPEYDEWINLGFKDTFAEVGAGAGYTKMDDPSLSPSRRIDYIFAAGPIANRLKSCRQLNERYFVPNSNPRFGNSNWALSDHLPILATFTGSSARPLPTGWVYLINKEDVGGGERYVLRAPSPNQANGRLRMDNFFRNSSTRKWKIEQPDGGGYYRIKNRNNQSLFLRSDPTGYENVDRDDPVIMTTWREGRTRRWKPELNQSEEAGYYNFLVKKPYSYNGNNNTRVYLRGSRVENDSANNPAFVDRFSRTSDTRQWLLVPADN